MTTEVDPANGNDGLTIQRGGESFRLEKSNERFVVKKRSTSARGSLEAAQATPAVFPDLRLQVTNSFGEMEVYSVRADSLDGAMTALRVRSHDVHWCTHVYHMPGDPEGLMVPTDQIYAEYGAMLARKLRLPTTILSSLIAAALLRAPPSSTTGGNSVQTPSS